LAFQDYIRFYLAFSLWLFLIVFSGLRSSPSPLPVPIPNFDKFLHFFIYFPIGIIIFYHPDFSWIKLVLILLLAFNLGFFIELGQSKTIGRSFEWLDLSSNILGTVGGLIIGFIFIRKGANNVKR